MPMRRKRPRAAPRRRWRDYETPTGHRPVKAFLDRLGDPDVAAIVAALREVERAGLAAAKHLRGEIYEVISKKTQKTPPERLRLAERRLADWRRRGQRR